MAVFSALKNKAKGKKAAAKPAAKKSVAKKSATKKSAPAKKAVAKKSPAKKAAPVKKVAAKPVKPAKVELKKDLSPKEVQQLVDLKNAVARQKEIVETLAASGIDNYRKAVKKEFMALALEARQLDEVIPDATEKARKAGLGAPSRILSKAQLALIAPKEEPKPVEAKGGKAAIVLDEDGNEIVVEEVELEDVETLIAEASEIIDAESDGKDQPRVVTLSDETKNEAGSFTLQETDAEDEEEDKNEREKHKKDPKSGELALKLIKPQDVPIEQYVMFKICHKMAKTGVNAEGTFEIIDTNKTGVIEQEEFKDSLRKVLSLWISPEDIHECFASLSNSQPVLRRKGFLEKLNFKQYLQDGLSERFSISRARFLNVLVEVSALRERQIASELFNLLGSDATISQQQFSSVLASVDPGVEAERAEWLWQKAEELSAGSAVSAKSVVRTLLRHRVGEYAESPFCMLQVDEGRFDPSLQPLADEGSDNSLTEAETLREGLHSNRLTI